MLSAPKEKIPFQQHLLVRWRKHFTWQKHQSNCKSKALSQFFCLCYTVQLHLTHTVRAIAHVWIESCCLIPVPYRKVCLSSASPKKGSASMQLVVFLKNIPKLVEHNRRKKLRSTILFSVVKFSKTCLIFINFTKGLNSIPWKRKNCWKTSVARCKMKRHSLWSSPIRLVRAKSKQ